MRLHVLVVVRETDKRPVICDTNEEGAAISVEESGNGLDHGIFHRFIAPLLAQVPASCRFELDGFVLDTCNEFLDAPGKRGCHAAQFPCAECGEFRIDAHAFNDSRGDLLYGNTRHSPVRDEHLGVNVVNARAIVAV